MREGERGEGEGEAAVVHGAWRRWDGCRSDCESDTEVDADLLAVRCSLSLPSFSLFFPCLRSLLVSHDSRRQTLLDVIAAARRWPPIMRGQWMQRRGGARCREGGGGWSHMALCERTRSAGSLRVFSAWTFFQLPQDFTLHCRQHCQQRNAQFPRRSPCDESAPGPARR